jgi:hypothetical protein
MNMQSNNPAGADCCKIMVVLPRLFAAAQPERYAAEFSVDSPLRLSPGELATLRGVVR